MTYVSKKLAGNLGINNTKMQAAIETTVGKMLFSITFLQNIDALKPSTTFNNGIRRYIQKASTPTKSTATQVIGKWRYKAYHPNGNTINFGV